MVDRNKVAGYIQVLNTAVYGMPDEERQLFSRSPIKDMYYKTRKRLLEKATNLTEGDLFTNTEWTLHNIPKNSTWEVIKLTPKRIKIRSVDDGSELYISYRQKPRPGYMGCLPKKDGEEWPIPTFTLIDKNALV